MGCVVALWLLTVGEVDRRTGRLPTVMLWPGIAAVTVTGSVGGEHRLLVAAVAACTPYVIAGMIGLVGGGDVKLAFVVGGLTGDPSAALVVVCAAQLIAAVGFARAGGRARPHGPALAGSAAVIVAAG
ncbi:prepilin peptidase [Gordonia sp. (in: high G+C Gram-positive bacteria)]|uniref:prepilin peptidase n=1 Tax=Gordonia sp. (in: high G+C Gram-positive bacteria) TaxID=84139 RepID=UPI0039E318A5